MTGTGRTIVSRPGIALADSAALGIALAVGTFGFYTTFAGAGRFLVAGIGGIILGLGLAFFTSRQRMGLVLTLGSSVLAYLLLGSALAAPEESVAGFVPTLSSLQLIVSGVVLSWKQLLTSAAPVGTENGLLVVPFLSAYAAALVTGTMAWRLRNPFWAVLPVLALMVSSTALGAHDSFLPAIRGVLLMAVVTAWLAYRRRQSLAPVGSGVRAKSSQPTRAAGAVHLRRALSGALVLTIAGSIALVVAPLVDTSTHRTVVRDSVVPPLDLHEYASPLESFRDYEKNQKDNTLFAVTGLQSGERIRLATLDSYDGVVFSASADGSSAFAPAGNSATLADAGPQSARTALQVRIGSYSGVWLPSIGSASGFSFGGSRAGELAHSLYFNRVTDTALVPTGVQDADTYKVSVVSQPQPAEAELQKAVFATVSLPRSENVPQIVTTKANEFVGDAVTPLDRVRKLETALSKQGAFSHGLDGEAKSLSGHGAQRIASLLSAKQMVGDDEQYAVAMTLMARELGIPARVVMGFYPDPQKPLGTGTMDIKGADVHAWVEVAFAGVGWVAFNPTPSKDNVPIPPAPQPKSKPQPQVLQPPPPPQAPAEFPPDSAPNAKDTEPSQQGLWAVIGPILAVVGIGLVPVCIVLLPLLLIAGLKKRRRTRRSVGGSPSERMSGGWSEVLSLATDLGTNVAGNATRRETAARLGESFPATGNSAVLLAQRADEAVFAQGDTTDDEILDYWRTVDASLEQMTGSVGFWRRQKAKFSPRSLAAEARFREVVPKEAVDWMSRVRFPRSLRRVFRRGPTNTGRG